MHTHQIQAPDTLCPHMLEACYALTVASCIAQQQRSQALRDYADAGETASEIQQRTDDIVNRLDARIDSLADIIGNVQAELCGVIPS